MSGLTDYDELALRAEKAEDGFNAASQKIKQLEARMAQRCFSCRRTPALAGDSGA